MFVYYLVTWIIYLTTYLTLTTYLHVLKPILRSIAMNMFVQMSPFTSLIIFLGCTMGRWTYRIKDWLPIATFLSGEIIITYILVTVFEDTYLTYSEEQRTLFFINNAIL